MSESAPFWREVGLCRGLPPLQIQPVGPLLQEDILARLGARPKQHGDGVRARGARFARGGGGERRGVGAAAAARVVV